VQKRDYGTYEKKGTNGKKGTTGKDLIQTFSGCSVI
jgi:hypothetical protein